jgi:hypothetical protein
MRVRLVKYWWENSPDFHSLKIHYRAWLFNEGKAIAIDRGRRE